MAQGMSDFAWASQRLVEAQDAEARRIARELHDDVGQALTAARLGLYHRLSGLGHDDLLAAPDTLKELRKVSFRLVDIDDARHPPVMD